MSEDPESALHSPESGTYCGSVCARPKLGRQQSLQLSPINVAVSYDLFSGHDAGTLFFSRGCCICYQLAKGTTHTFPYK